MAREKETWLWKDRRHNWLGLPWTFTRYRLDKDCLYITTGFFNTKEDEIRLYRITDITMTRSLWQKLIHTGSIHCDSADQTMKNFDIKNIKKPGKTKKLLSNLIEQSRRENRVYMRENMATNPHGAADGPGEIDLDGVHPDSFDFEMYDHPDGTPEPDDD